MRSLGATYDAVLEEVRSAVLLRQALIRRAAPWHMRWAHGLMVARFPFFLGQSPERLRERLKNAATADDREHPHYGTVTGNRFMDDLASAICDRFSIDGQKASALLKLQAERQVEREGLMRVVRLTPLKGIALGVAAVLASQVPKESFEVLGWSGAYGWYRLAVFGALMLLLLYVALAALVSRLLITTDEPPRAVREAMRLVLLHCEFRRR